MSLAKYAESLTRSLGKSFAKSLAESTTKNLAESPAKNFAESSSNSLAKSFLRIAGILLPRLLPGLAVRPG